MKQGLALLLAMVIVLAAGGPVEARALLSPSAHVVGNGDPNSCTPAELFAVLDLGGAITFNCGAAPKVILFTTPKAITATASLDGGNLITLSGNNVTRLFEIAGGFSLSLSQITLSNARYSSDGGAIGIDPGGALIVDRATFRANKTDSAYSGGAILNDRGTLSISNSLFDSNVAGNGGALYPRYTSSSTTINNSLFTHNSTNNTIDGWGGAVLAWDGAPVSVQGSQFISNTARWGGALYLALGASSSYSTSLTLTNSYLGNNLASSDPSADGGGGAIYNNGRLVLAGTSLENNVVVVPPGFSFSGIRGGGAIWNSDGGIIQMSGGALRGNRALRGGALFSIGNVSIDMATLADNLAGRGGAIENDNDVNNRLTISATTLSNNAVSFALYPSITTPLGGAIFNTGQLDVTNSTISGNSGDTALKEDNSVITLTNVTLAENLNGGLASDQSPNTSQVRLFNTLLADNGSHNCGPIYFGSFTSHNGFSSDNTCAGWGSDNLPPAAALLSQLGYHFGPTLTHMLDANSPAVNNGANCPPVDQRGISRPQDVACDIGAVERRANDAFYFIFLPLTRR